MQLPHKKPDHLLRYRSLGPPPGWGEGTPGTNTGSLIDIEDTLKFSLLQNVRATVEKVPFEQAPKAYEKMLANEARFRVVIEMKTAVG